jgi:hypothetical protein
VRDFRYESVVTLIDAVRGAVGAKAKICNGRPICFAGAALSADAVLAARAEPLPMSLSG